MDVPVHPTPPPPQTIEATHVAALDGMRGLAILMVMAHHLIYVNDSARGPFYTWVRAIKESLWSGVDVFFALSGFLITGILIKTVGSPGYFRNFYARRALRIFPLYYGVLFLLFACTHYLNIHWGGQQWRLLTYTNHIFLETHAFGYNFYFGHGVNLIYLWSLHVEEQFYLVWPLLIFLVRSPRKLLPIAFVLSLSSFGLRVWLARRGVSHEVLYTTLITRADNLLVGACLAIVLRTRHRALAFRSALPVFVASTLGLAAFFLTHHGLTRGGSFSFSIPFTLLAFSSTALIALCLDQRSKFARFFSVRPLRFFGRYSYGLYLFHVLVPLFIGAPLLRLLVSIAGRPRLAHIVTTLIDVAVAVLVSMLSYRFFERPFLRLKRSFRYMARPTIPELMEQPAAGEPMSLPSR